MKAIVDKGVNAFFINLLIPIIIAKHENAQTKRITNLRVANCGL